MASNAARNVMKTGRQIAPRILGNSRKVNKTKPVATPKIKKSGMEGIMMTWRKTSDRIKVPNIVRGSGIRLYDDTGKEFIDWTSQAVCSNLGHTVPSSIKAAINKQLDEIGFVYGGLSMTNIRMELTEKMAEVTPMKGFLFPTSGAEANEAAIRIARRYTGRRKVISTFNSYHGGTATTLSASGDKRRLLMDEEYGHVKTASSFEPFAIQMIEAQILGEGPGSIAAIILESITGAGGVYRHSVGYIKAVRRLCDEHDIVLIMDEVMAGCGRTGKMWGYQHYPITPDIITTAKGLSGSYIPLSCTAISEKIRDHFADDTIAWGSTYQAHPTAMACGLATLQYLEDHKIVERVATLEPLMLERATSLVNKYDFFDKNVRMYGLFGCLDFVNDEGQKLQEPGTPPLPLIVRLQENLTKNGIYGIFRSPFFHCAPPLTITPDEVNEAWDRIDKACAEV